MKGSVSSLDGLGDGDHDRFDVLETVSGDPWKRIKGRLVGLPNHYVQGDYFAHWHLPTERGIGEKGPYLCAIFQWLVCETHPTGDLGHFWGHFESAHLRIGSDDVQQVVFVDAVEIVDDPKWVKAEMRGWS